MLIQARDARGAISCHAAATTRPPGPFFRAPAWIFR